MIRIKMISGWGRMVGVRNKYVGFKDPRSTAQGFGLDKDPPNYKPSSSAQVSKGKPTAKKRNALTRAEYIYSRKRNDAV